VSGDVVLLQFALSFVTVWNSLPDEVVSADSLSLFITRLGAVEMSVFLSANCNVYF